MSAVLVAALSAASGSAGESMGTLTWNDSQGVIWNTPHAVLHLDAGEGRRGPILRATPDGGEFPLVEPRVEQASGTELTLTYQLSSPKCPPASIRRDIVVQEQANGIGLVETMSISLPIDTAEPWRDDVEIDRPFTVKPRETGDQGLVVWPLKNGWAREFRLGDDMFQAEYRLGNPMTGPETLSLALPVACVHTGRLDMALVADPTFSALFELRERQGTVAGTVRYRYAGSRVPLQGTEVRQFGVWFSHELPATPRLDKSLDAFFALMLADVAVGPPWLHDIAMIDYDFLSDDGEGWKRDVQALAEWLAPVQRRRVALCLHGWYDALGSYCFDSTTRQLKNEWIAFGLTRRVHFTQEELRQRLHLARALGFRVLLYFGDGLAADSGVPGYEDSWAYRRPDGRPITGWQGPDTYGTTYLRNAAHPAVGQWYLDYCDALLHTYGDEFDGLVWDETFHAPLGQIASEPVPAYCDRANLALIRALAQRVHAFDPQKVFLASDCIGVPGMEDVPGYAMVAHGTWQDSGCRPVAWSYGLFPNWRNVLWSCNWSPIGNFHYTCFGVEEFGTPVAISNGWGDDCGASEWQPAQRNRILDLFQQRCAQTSRVRYLTTDPAEILALGPQVSALGDPLPEPDPASTNWALVTHGSVATASSEMASGCPAAGAIDGVRDDTGWGAGHGWASAPQTPLPQWLEVTFPQPRRVRRLVVITYQKEGTDETAGKWGIEDYELQAWSDGSQAWQSIVTVHQTRAVKTRVHDLPQSLDTTKIRLLVRRVAPLDGQARLLQLEAWGPTKPTP